MSGQFDFAGCPGSCLSQRREEAKAAIRSRNCTDLKVEELRNHSAWLALHRNLEEYVGTQVVQRALQESTSFTNLTQAAAELGCAVHDVIKSAVPGDLCSLDLEEFGKIAAFCPETC